LVLPTTTSAIKPTTRPFLRPTTRPFLRPTTKPWKPKLPTPCKPRLPPCSHLPWWQRWVDGGEKFTGIPMSWPCEEIHKLLLVRETLRDAVSKMD